MILNPKTLYYSLNFKVDTKVKIDLLQCIQRMVTNTEEQHFADLQVKDFKNRENLFCNPLTIKAIRKKTLAAWCESYGDEHLEFQRFAICV